MLKIGSKVKKLRELKNFTQSYLADYLSITQSTYSRYEKDELHFTKEMLQKLSQIFGLSVEAMQYFEEEKLFLYLESICNCARYQTAREQQLTEAFIKELQCENEELRLSLQELRLLVTFLQHE
ncbi:MAG: helix-turn-helix domain-containing protein [Bacteroidia bacterium]